MFVEVVVQKSLNAATTVNPQQKTGSSSEVQQVNNVSIFYLFCFADHGAGQRNALPAGVPEVL